MYKRTYRYVLLAQNFSHEVKALRKRGKERVGLKGKIDKHENSNKGFLLFYGVYK